MFKCQIEIRLSIALMMMVSLVGHLSAQVDEKNVSTERKVEWMIQSLKDGENQIFDNKIWCYLRFSKVPSAETKSQLKSKGIDLYQYEPNLKWFASLPTNITAKSLVSNGVRKLYINPKDRKCDHFISSGNLPGYIESKKDIEAVAVVAASDQFDQLLERLKQEDIKINDLFKPLGFVKLSGSLSSLKAISKIPFVIYVELTDPPEVLEFEDEISLTRGTFINGYYNPNQLNGEGVNIAVNEGGTVDSSNSVDFKNRLDRSLESGNTSGHKTGVGLRMASAGNINPQNRGMAWGATLHSGGINFTNAAQGNINIVNNSFGYGCISGSATYNFAAATNDFLVRTNNNFMITYSCGNIGGSNCNSYGAGPGWGSITGLTKSAKNIFAVGAMNTNDQLTGFSSRGPAMDGRILPDITAAGPGGTSFASPNLAGVYALLTEAYRNENNGSWPNSGLIKAIILNSPDDIENPGPDYTSGFGRINASRALEVIENNQFLTDNISNNGTKNHAISVPGGVSQLKVSLYWTDREATPGITGKTLVNDLDLRIQKPNGSWINPWILNPTANPDSLNKHAIRGIDTLNNIELVTIENPSPGSYSAEVAGTLVPYGPQQYNIVYSFVYDSIKIIYPHGGEQLVPGENRRIRWDAYDSTGTFNIEFSSDSGVSWQQIASGIPGSSRSFTWTIPNNISGDCIVKVSRGNLSDVSNKRFTIAQPPQGLDLIWRCADSAMISWDSVPGALGYRVYKLGNKFMDTLAFTNDINYKLYNLSFQDDEWVSVQTVLPDSGSSRRAISISIPPTNLNCIPYDISLEQVLTPDKGFYPACIASDSIEVKVQLKNTGVNSVSFIPLAYQFNGGPIIRDTAFTSLNSVDENVFTFFNNSLQLQNGSNFLKAWIEFTADGNPSNDTITKTITVYNSGINATIPYTQNFDNFINCSTAWGCASVSCNLTQGWYNIPNSSENDSIDWRTHSGGTGSGNTGPSSDHTTGNGRYLYLEGSGNGGSGCKNKTAMANSPCFDLAGTNNPTLSYWYHAYGSSIGSLHIDVFTQGKWHLNIATPVVGPQGNQWIQQQVSLNQFIGENVIIRFRGETGNGYTGDLAIDDINLTSLPNAKFKTAYDTFCLGQQINLQNLSTYSNTYSWTVSPGTYTYTFGNNNSQNPIITANDTGWYDIQLISTNVFGNDTHFVQNAFYVTDVTSTITSDSPDNTYCSNDTATFTALGYASNYKFYYNSSLVQDSPSQTWSTTGLSDGDSVQVQGQINATCSFLSPKVYVSVKTDLNGVQLTTNDSDLTICEGDTVIIETQQGLSNYNFYTNGSLTKSGSDHYLQTDQLNDGDIIYCEVQDSAGCFGITDSLIWSVNAIPQQPTISNIGNDSLKASTSASTYSWWLDLQLLNQTGQSILADANGNYEVMAINMGCESKISSPFAFQSSGNNEFKDENIKIYPNPTRDHFYVLIEEEGFNNLIITNNTGKEIKREVVARGLNRIMVKRLASGTYYVKLLGFNKSLIYQLIVM
ncbi:MAG: S8 family serine peptidase [Salibacter sp.]|uniref:S8 family serine peptidase n=1 Tax=Salibacter sp. TaxID=2010995 RepID=UPI00286FC6A9|nr:S8 family serine peptidase [Salibacter sp.]MDR9398061.1 S8 family serine peptidase [Salibacter sp.]